MQHSHVLRATACAACLLIGGAAFAQGVVHAHAAHVSGVKGGFSKVAVHGAVGGRGFHGGGYHGGWGGGPAFAYGWGYPYDYGYDYGYPGYAYDYGYPNDNGYGYDYGYAPRVYAQSGTYCQTPENSCALDRPSVAGALPVPYWH